MTSIVNFDGKLKDRTSNVILESLNRMNDAKLSGVLGEDEFAKILILVGDLFANQIKQGKVTLDTVDDFESLLFGLNGPNKDKYFRLIHSGLDNAVNTIYQGNSFALSTQEKRSQYSYSITKEDEYNGGYRKVA